MNVPDQNPSRMLFFPKALRRVLPENPLNTDTSTYFDTYTYTLTLPHLHLNTDISNTYASTLTLEHEHEDLHFYTYPSVSGRVKASNGKYPSAKVCKCKSVMSMQCVCKCEYGKLAREMS